MPLKRTFDDLTDDDGSLGDDEGEADYSSVTDVNRSSNSPVPHLPLPTNDDDLETLERKMAAFADVVRKGESLAEHTGFQYPTDAGKVALSFAKMTMSAEEKMWYKAWKGGSFIPTAIPFAQMKIKIDPTKKGRLEQEEEEEEETAAILCILYKISAITTDQAREWKRRVGKWKEQKALRSLYRAIELVERQKVHLSEKTNGIFGLTQDEVVELRTAKKLVTLATKRVVEVITQAEHSIQGLKEDGIEIESSNIPRLLEDIRQLCRETHRHCRAVQERVAALRAKTALGKNKRARLNL
ncbi:MAG: hypothetical protein Q9174_006216 [Haloplaca sp. 1 TL-2023]